MPLSFCIIKGTKRSLMSIKGHFSNNAVCNGISMWLTYASWKISQNKCCVESMLLEKGRCVIIVENCDCVVFDTLFSFYNFIFSHNEQLKVLFKYYR